MQTSFEGIPSDVTGSSMRTRKSLQFTANVTSHHWQLAKNSFLKYSSALRQTSQNFYSAKKTRQHVVDKFMRFNSAKKTCQHDVDKFMKMNKIDEFASSTEIFTAFKPLFSKERQLRNTLGSKTNVSASILRLKGQA